MDPAGAIPWHTLTRLGAAGVLLPLFALSLAALAVSGERALLRRWGLLLCASALLVLGSKIAFLAFGVGCRACDFTGISGHATLAAAILPVWLTLAARRLGPVWPWLSSPLAIALPVLVAWSRVEVGAHSPSESAAGWALGTLVALATLVPGHRARAGSPQIQSAWLPAAGLVLALSLSPRLSGWLPTHNWERDMARALAPGGLLHHRREWTHAPRG